MQEKKLELPQEPIRTPGIPAIEKKTKLMIPECWKKKKMSPKLLDELKKTVEREPEVTDRFGEYRIGTFLFGDCIVMVAKENGLYHLSISANHPLGYHQIKTARYKFIPNSCIMAQIFPSREEFVNLHENCYHMYEIPRNL
jgi:hypothetical protein